MARKAAVGEATADKQTTQRGPNSVIIPTELVEGHRITIIIQQAGATHPSSWSHNLSSFWREASYSFLPKRPSVNWDQVRDDLWSDDRTIIRLPEDHFRFCKRVRPAVIGVCATTNQRVVLDASQRASGRNRPVLVILESPHEDEYTKDNCFTPLGPLLNPGGRTRVRNQLPRLLGETNIPWESFVGSEVILLNPVPFQASLHRFMKASQKGVNRGVCNQVWRALFEAQDDKGRAILRTMFLKRIERLQPGLILNACTDPLWYDVETALKELDGNLFPHRLVNQHPAVWGSKTHIVTEQQRKLKGK